MKAMIGVLDRQGGPEILVTNLILALQKFGFSETSFQTWKQVWDGLSIVPDVGTGSDTTSAASIKTTFKCP